MATITTRAGKGSPLTNAEVDSNFTNLNTAKYESGDDVSLGTGTFSGAVTWGAGSSVMNAGNPRSLRIGYSGGNYGALAYGINFTTTSGTHTYAIADVVTLVDANDGIIVKAAPTGTVNSNVAWTTVLDARRSNANLLYKGNVVLASNNFNSYAPTLTGTGAYGLWGISITGSAASATGNAATATTLATPRTINGVSFNGSANITVEPYVEDAVTTSAVRYLTFVDNSTAGYKRLNEDSDLTYNPGTNTLTVPTVAAALTGNVTGNVTGNATTATTLQTARTIALSGDATGSVSFNGSANVTIPVVIADDSHIHDGRYYTKAEADGRFIESSAYIDFTVAGDSNTYYPVLVGGYKLYAWGVYNITRGYSWTAPDTWNTATHRGGLTLSWRWSGDTGWGGNDQTLVVEQFKETYSTMVGGMVLTTSGLVVWLRGGTAQYRYYCPAGDTASATVYLTGYTASNGTVYSSRADNSGNSEIYSKWSLRGTTVYSGGYETLTTGNYNSYSPTLAGVGATGSWGISITGNAATSSAASATVATLTRGSYLTGNNFNGSVATTWAVDATSANTASKVVARDASGNFSAGTITAALSGNATTATTLQTIRTINGVNFNGSANITVEPYVEDAVTTSATRYITFVDNSTAGYKRLNEDADFTYNPGTNTVTANTFSGALSGNATTATTLQTARTIALSGAATGTATSFNGGANITIPVTALDASSLNSGTVPDARLTGVYSGVTLQTNGGNTHYTTPNSGSASTNDRTVFGLAQYKNDLSSTTGAIVFYAPNTNSTIMHRLRIEGMIYSGGPTVMCVVQGYRTTGAWSSTSKINLGITDIQVRLGVDPSGKNCVILGDVGTVWSYPMMAITHAMFSHSGVTDAYCKDWTVGLVTDLTLYTNVTGTIANTAVTTNITGNATTATTLQTARTIGGVSFNGSANINLPGVNTAGNQSTSGNAATATTLQTARTINGVSFNGSANITVADSTKLPLAGGTATGTINAPTFNATSTTNGGFQGIDADTATAPSFTWTGDLNTGMYRENVDSIGFTAGGVLRLTVNATAVTASGNVTAYSDERLKTNWRPMPTDYVKRLASVRVGIYDRTDAGKLAQVGVSAQSLQELLPQAIIAAKDEMQTLSVAYGNAALASAVELAKDNVELRARIERLETIINNLVG